jgi:hypothetical protein
MEAMVVSPPDQIAVRVTPAQARLIASALQIELAVECEGVKLEPIPGRDAVRRIRDALDKYQPQLEMLKWGEPEGEVELRSPRGRLEHLARNLLEGGREWLSDPDSDTAAAHQYGNEMIAAAGALRAALSGAGR